MLTLQEKETLLSFLRYASVSADSNYTSQVQACAQWLANYLEGKGFSVQILPTLGHPIVYAEQIVDAALPTVLVYGHYDVQPPDPLMLWESPPFEPTERNGAIYARGASDDKGQVFLHFIALDRLKASLGKLPCNVKFLLEGEEEIGSPSLFQEAEKYKDLWRCEVIVVSDTALHSLSQPTITVGLRGLIYAQIDVTGPSRDLHSGSFGGIIDNPAHVLALVLARLRKEDGEITIPEFYRDVAPLSREEWEAIQILEPPKGYYEELTGAPKVSSSLPAQRSGYGESLLARIALPTLDINGMWSGYTGEGSKTIIPSTAHAKISMRLVPNQDPHHLWTNTEAYLKELFPPTVRYEVRLLSPPTPPFFVSTQSLPYKIAERAMQKAFGVRPLPIREGGSIPVLSFLAELLGVPVLLLGFGLHTDAVHSPNEHFQYACMEKGIATLENFYVLYPQAL